MSFTFGNRPGDVVADSRGNTLSGVTNTFYATKADALARTSPLGSATATAGEWSFTADVPTLWVRTPAGKVYAITSAEATTADFTDQVNAAKASAATSATAAAAAQTAAENAASLVGAPADTVMAGLLNNPASLAAQAVGTTYATKTTVAGKLDSSVAATTYVKPAIPAGVAALTKAVPTVDAAAYLRPWHAALARRFTRRANVVLLGDSWVEGQGATTTAKRFGDRLAAALRAAYPVAGVTGGRGFIATNTATNTASDWPCTRGGTTPTGYSDASGPALWTYAMHPGASAINWASFALVGTSADIMYPKGPSYGTIQWQVDGGAATNIAQANTSIVAGNLTRVSLGTAGAHTLLTTGVTSGSFLNGVIEYNGDEAAGITVHSAGHGGFKAGDFTPSSPTANWPAAVNALQPDAVVVEVGINDKNGGLSAATFQTNLTAMVTNLRAGLAATVPVILFVPPACKGWSATWGDFANAIYAVATAQGCLVADLSLRLPDKDGDTFGMWSAAVGVGDFHLSDDGHQAVADALARYLAP